MKTSTEKLMYRSRADREAYLEQRRNRRTVFCDICRTVHQEVRINPNRMTGEIRGLLCRTCAAGLNNFQDSISLLRSAVEYLRQTTYGGNLED